MEEIWKDVVGYEGLYKVSNTGKIYSIKNDRILKQQIVRGYCKATLCRDGKQKQIGVHRVVAMAFIPNPNNLPQVNHIDENQLNNHVENLEWCDCKYNINFGTAIQRRRENYPTRREIDQYDKHGNLMRTWFGLGDIQIKTGYNAGAICECCNGKRDYYKNSVWRYKDEPFDKYEQKHPESPFNRKRKSFSRYDLNGRLVDRWKSVREASEKLNIPYQTIVEWCNKEYERMGYIWKYD